MEPETGRSKTRQCVVYLGRQKCQKGNSGYIAFALLVVAMVVIAVGNYLQQSVLAARQALLPQNTLRSH
jgi:hypothetical protein